MPLDSGTQSGSMIGSALMGSQSWGIPAGFDSEGAAAFILGIVTASGPTPGEVLTDRAIAAGYKPHDARAFGPVYATLVRRGSIRCVGFCERKKGHSTAGGRIWSAA